MASQLGSHIPFFFSNGNRGEHGLLTSVCLCVLSEGTQLTSVALSDLARLRFKRLGCVCGRHSQVRRLEIFCTHRPDKEAGLFYRQALLFKRDGRRETFFFLPCSWSEIPASLTNGCDLNKLRRLQKAKKLPMDLSKFITLISVDLCEFGQKISNYLNLTNALKFLIMVR